MISLFTTVVALLAPGHGEGQVFTLRSELDTSIMEALDTAEKELSTEILNDRESSKLSSTVVMDLKPLYFHLHNLAVQVSDMRLTSSEFVMEETNMDVLGRRMMPLVYFHWAEVSGKLKTGLDTNLPQKFEFRLVENYLRGQGVVSLTVDLTNILWSYFDFKFNSSSIKIQNSQDVNPDVYNVLNSTYFSDLLAKKLQRDISHQLTTVVCKNINQALKKSSKMTSLDPYSEDISAVGINNTENANAFIDSLITIGRELIRNKFHDRIRIPDIKESFSEKILVTFRGSFQATKGTAIGASSVYRIGDVVFGGDNEGLLHFYGTLGFKALHLYYDYYKAEMWGIGPSGSLDTRFAPASILVHVHLNTSSKMMTLEKFKVANAGDLDVSLTGLGGMFNWLVSRVTTWVMGMYRDQILERLEAQYEQYGRHIFATYSIDDLLNGGKNEAYVL